VQCAAAYRERLFPQLLPHMCLNRCAGVCGIIEGVNEGCTCLPLVLPPCLPCSDDPCRSTFFDGRYYVAEGVRLYSQETWRLVMGEGGREAVAKCAPQVGHCNL